MTKATSLISLVCFASGILVGANAQESARDTPLTRREWPAPGKLQLRVDDLERNRKQISEALSDDFRRSRSYETRPIMLDALRRKINQSFRQRESHYDDIRLRLDRLENALANQRKTRPAAPIPLVPQAQTPTDPKPPTAPAAEDPSVGEEPTTPATVSPPTLTKPPEPDPIKPSPTVVTETAVDRIGLADSLFASHQVDIALKLYLELSREKQSPEDLLWIHYQIGSSSRRVKNYDQARRYYRMVAGKPEAGLYQKLSKWWLDTLQRKLNYEEEQNRLQAFLDRVGTPNVTAAK